MPPRAKVTKDDIVQAGLALVREEGQEALNARGVSQRLGCSTQPIFSNYGTMAELRQDIIAAADKIYQAHIAQGMQDPRYPPYKGSGMAYIDFARRERQLFKLLFMRDRTGETIREDRSSIAPILDILQKNLGLSPDEAYRFHMELWIYVHGIGVMLATNYLDWGQETTEAMLSDVYEGLRARYQSRKGD
jgi:AcrR family transcriptional regulator